MTARRLLDAVGGRENVDAVAMCMTRLRLELNDPKLANFGDLNQIHRVLSVRTRGEHGVEVVFGPAVVDAIAREVATITGQPLHSRHSKAITAFSPIRAQRAGTDRPGARLLGTSFFSPSSPKSLDRQDLDHLRELLAMTEDPAERPDAADPVSAKTLRLLVINGPNMNLLGLREPDIYGRRTYDDLVELCLEEGEEAGFSEVRCFQSNHEGDLVDTIQEARGRFDGIVMNPAAYTHTSVAILDALKAVGIPCVEVHVSDVPEREEFRQISYVRSACIGCVMGEGLDGYAHAIRILADHLRARQGEDPS